MTNCKVETDSSLLEGLEGLVTFSLFVYNISTSEDSKISNATRLTLSAPKICCRILVAHIEYRLVSYSIKLDDWFKCRCKTSIVPAVWVSRTGVKDCIERYDHSNTFQSLVIWILLQQMPNDSLLVNQKRVVVLLYWLLGCSTNLRHSWQSLETYDKCKFHLHPFD